MSEDVVLVDNAIATEDVEKDAGVLERLAAVVALQHGHHLWGPGAGVLQSSKLDGGHKANSCFDVRVRQLLLDQLERSQGDVELLPIQRIFPCLLDAVFECSDDTKADAEACVAVEDDMLDVSLSTKGGPCARTHFRQLKGPLRPDTLASMLSVGTSTSSM